MRGFLSGILTLIGLAAGALSVSLAVEKLGVEWPAWLHAILVVADWPGSAVGDLLVELGNPLPAWWAEAIETTISLWLLTGAFFSWITICIREDYRRVEGRDPEHYVNKVGWWEYVGQEAALMVFLWPRRLIEDIMLTRAVWTFRPRRLERWSPTYVVTLLVVSGIVVALALATNFATLR